MEVQKVYDEAGSWIINSGVFTFVDPTNGNRFDPGVKTKAPVTDWIKGQPVLKVEAPAKVEAPTKAEVKPAVKA